MDMVSTVHDVDRIWQLGVTRWSFRMSSSHDKRRHFRVQRMAFAPGMARHWDLTFHGILGCCAANLFGAFRIAECCWRGWISCELFHLCGPCTSISVQFIDWFTLFIQRVYSTIALRLKNALKDEFSHRSDSHCCPEVC